jgi:hypothetical protein
MAGRPTILALMAAALLPLGAGAQARTVTLLVTDSIGNPIPFAAIGGGSTQTITDRHGEARLPRVQAGTVKLHVRRIGFSPEMVAAVGERDTTIHVVLSPIATMLQAQVVTARSVTPLQRTGFYDRMRDRERGLLTGTFILPEDIEQRKPSQISHMLHGLPGVRVDYVSRGRVGGVPRGADGCAMTIYLDGARLVTYGTQVGPSRSGDGIDQILSATTIEAIEVYPRANRAPSMYQLMNGTCGIIALWSKV